MRLSEFNIKHLRVFLAVVECSGFSAAEDVLGMSQSSISAAISQFEAQLGYRICERGRAGFSLTPRGEELYKHALTLSGAVAEFEEGASSLKSALAGRLRIALIDNIITDPHCPLTTALSALNDLSGVGPRVSIDVLTPGEIEQAVATQRVDVGISIAEQRLPSLKYRRLYGETDRLYCGRQHPLFHVTDRDVLRNGVEKAAKVVRSFLNHQDFLLLSDREDTIRATATNLEAAAFLILAGTHIGFMPEHYAERWVKTEEIRPLLSEEYFRNSEIMMILKDKGVQSPVLRLFRATLEKSAERFSSKF